MSAGYLLRRNTPRDSSARVAGEADAALQLGVDRSLEAQELNDRLADGVLVRGHHSVARKALVVCTLEMHWVWARASTL